MNWKRRPPLRKLLRNALMVLVTIVFGIPLAVRAEPAVVKIGVFISSISGIDPADGSFRIACYVWARGPVGAFDLTQDLEVLGRSALIKPIATATLPDGDGYQAVLVEAVLNQRYDLKSFPFDRQSLRLQVESAKGTSRVILEPDSDDSRIADFVTLPGWHIEGLTLSGTEFTYDTNFGYRTDRPTFSRLDVRIDVERKRSILMLERFTGFLVAMCLTALVFLVPPSDLGIRVGIITGSIFAAVFNRYRLEDKIGFETSFGLIDQITLMSFSAIILVLLISLYSFGQAEKRSAVSVARIDRRLGSGVMGLYVGLIAVVMLLALI